MFSRCDGYRDCKAVADSDYQLSMRQLRQTGDDNGGDAKAGVIIRVLIHWACYLLSRCKCRLVQMFISEDVYRSICLFSALVVGVGGSIVWLGGLGCCCLLCYCIFRINKLRRERNNFLASQQPQSFNNLPPGECTTNGMVRELL